MTNSNKNAGYWIKKLNLQAHPEGGYFAEIYRSGFEIDKKCLPKSFDGNRSSMTSIYFLLEGENKSNFHKLVSDEIWYYHQGGSVDIYCIAEDGELNIKKLGSDFENGEILQVIIPAGTWFAAEVTDKSYYSLMGCTVSPGFDFQDFTLAKRNELKKEFPQHTDVINTFSIK